MGEHHFSLRSPSPTSCCQLQDPCPEGPVVGWALEAPLPHLAEFCGVSPGFAEFPLQWLVLEWAPGRARGCMGQGEHGSFSLQDTFGPKQAKIPHLYTGRRPKQQFLCWETLYSSEMRNQLVFHSIPKGQECRWRCRHPQVQPWLSMPGSPKRAVWEQDRILSSRKDPLTDFTF